ncbi:MAG: hypothetical protein VKL59_07540 [Nostocaceae cyanobacterium]|nr:hypothetical protein [Nostocaceae cyanobacterium]
MQAIKNNELFTEISAEESAVVSGGDTIVAGVNLAQIIFAFGAAQYTFLTTGGNAALANSVLDTQFNRAFSSIFTF